jgi:kynurenine formamidase
MKLSDLANLPTFDQLPISPSAPAESSWGVFENEALGCLNFLTPEGIVDAARLVQRGKVFRLDAPIGFARPPLFFRTPAVHNILPLGPFANDDRIDTFNTQEGSQWDGLRHVGHPTHGAYYNGVKAEEVTPGPGGRLGIHNWADKLVGRGVLIDAYGFRKECGIPVNPLETGAYTLDELKAALSDQGTTLQPGSVLLVRTGWMEAYAALTPEGKADIAPIPNLHSIGIEASREMVAWLWDNRVAAIATDNPSVEPFPFDFTSDTSLHRRALPLLGLPLGELFVLKPLAEDCAADGHYEFMLISAPLHLEGGVASPPNAVAIK